MKENSFLFVIVCKEEFFFFFLCVVYSLLFRFRIFSSPNFLYLYGKLFLDSFSIVSRVTNLHCCMNQEKFVNIVPTDQILRPNLTKLILITNLRYLDNPLTSANIIVITWFQTTLNKYTQC